MSLISEHVETLRKFAEQYRMTGVGIKNTVKILNKSADIIEILSDQLSSANMERSIAYYNGGWIPVEKRLPEEKGWYLVFVKNQRPFVAYFKGKTFSLNNHYHEIVAWRSLPEPYKE